ncbi:MAG: hypothetical protein M3R17_14235 [Bacteroidota bacterium]|nr:hypothetical protein [Bacteroidota bacterium]
MKKFQTRLLVAFTLVILVLFSNCNKYEDGPAISLRTKKHRVCNSWRIDQVFETPQNGSQTDKTTDYKNAYVNYVMMINKSDLYTITYRPYNIGDYSETGSWYLSAGKSNLVFVNANGNGSSIGSVWTILRLKENELWMQTRNSNNVIIEVHLLPN